LSKPQPRAIDKRRFTIVDQAKKKLARARPASGLVERVSGLGKTLLHIGEGWFVKPPKRQCPAPISYAPRSAGSNRDAAFSVECS
jgi:hypothetical protein